MLLSIEIAKDRPLSDTEYVNWPQGNPQADKPARHPAIEVIFPLLFSYYPIPSSFWVIYL